MERTDKEEVITVFQPASPGDTSKKEKHWTSYTKEFILMTTKYKRKAPMGITMLTVKKECVQCTITQNRKE